MKTIKINQMWVSIPAPLSVWVRRNAGELALKSHGEIFQRKSGDPYRDVLPVLSKWIISPLHMLGCTPPEVYGSPLKK